MPFNNFPYTNLNDFNLDWILKKIKSLESAISQSGESPIFRVFKTCEDMKTEATLTPGEYAVTMGYHEAGDGGAAMYEISETSSRFHEATVNGYANLLDPFSVKQFGAWGDGTHDDTAALNALFKWCARCYIPEGYYNFSSTLVLTAENRCDVEADGKAMLIATGADSDYSGGVLINLYGGTGYNPLGIRWNGGVINCNGVPNVTGVNVPATAGDFTLIERMFIYDIGDNSIGFKMGKTSGKALINQLVCSCAGIVYDVNDKDSSWSFHFSRDGINRLMRNTIGYYNDEAFDYTIQNLMTLGTTYGIYSKGGSEIQCDAFWAISDVMEGTKLTAEQYHKTRAFYGVTGNAVCHWSIDHFYPDDYYIACEAPFFESKTTHLICCYPDYVTDESPVSYLAKPNKADGILNFGSLTIDENSGSYMGCRIESPVSPNAATYHQIINSDLLQNDVSKYHNGFSGRLAGKTLFKDITFVANTRYIIGYILKQPGGYGEIVVNSSNHFMTGKVKIKNTNQALVIESATYSARSSSAGTYKIGIGPQIVNSDEQLAMFPIFISTTAAHTDTVGLAFNNYIGFVGPWKADVFDGTPTAEVEFTAE